MGEDATVAETWPDPTEIDDPERPAREDTDPYELDGGVASVPEGLRLLLKEVVPSG